MQKGMQVWALISNFSEDVEYLDTARFASRASEGAELSGRARHRSLDLTVSISILKGLHRRRVMRLCAVHA